MSDPPRQSGSRVVALDLWRPADEPFESDPNDVPCLDGLRVLVIDDEHDSLELAATVLRTFGAEVLTAYGCSEGLAFVDGAELDAVVCDLAMPGESGLVFIRRLREAEMTDSRRLPAATFTGFTSAKHTAAAFAAGFDIHLPKPIDPITFATAVAMLAGRCE